MKQNKYKYLLVIQQNYSNVWEDVSEYDATSTGTAKDRQLLRHDRNEYQILGYPTRVIFRKEINKINLTH